MKKLISLIIIFAFIASMNACSKSDVTLNLSPYREEAAPNKNTYHFASYEDIYEALTNQESALRKDGQESDYGVNYRNFLAYFSMDDSKIMVPTCNDVLMDIEGTAEWQKITLFTEELHKLPWIWYYCSYNNKTIVVGTTYYDLLGMPETDAPLSFVNILDTIAPNFPSPSNAESYTDAYDSIYERNLILSGNKTTTAVVYDFAESERVHYRFVYDNVIVSMWIYEGGEITDDFWLHFSLSEYK